MKKILIPLIAALALISCNESDDSNSQNSIAGNYNLVNVSGSIAGVSNDFDPGVIRWHIDGENQSLTVINNFDDNNGSIEDFMETGSYTFETTTNETAGQCNYKYLADDNDLGCLSIETDGTLVFTQPYADGYILTLKPE
jgi:hypothetical protein